MRLTPIAARFTGENGPALVAGSDLVALALDNRETRLLANRLCRCPVLFYEPYVMNSGEVHARIQAGDYPGERTVAGARRRSIFREYADAVAEGLRRHYQQARR